LWAHGCANVVFRAATEPLLGGIYPTTEEIEAFFYERPYEGKTIFVTVRKDYMDPSLQSTRFSGTLSADADCRGYTCWLI
jgi:hypothetical protein